MSHGVALLGAGWVADRYVEVLRDEPRTEVVGIYTRTPEKAAALLAAHGVEGRVYASEDELFDDERVEIVISCTPPDVRREHLVRAAESGRHVVIEKPVAPTLDAVVEIRDAVARAGVKSVTSFVLRWNPQFETTAQLVADGFLGELLYAEADYWHPLPRTYDESWIETGEAGVSAFVAAGCHAADQLRRHAGEVVEVSARSAPTKLNDRLRWDPVVVAAVTFENGAVGKLSCVMECDTPHLFNVRLLGTEGTIQNNRIYSTRKYPGARDYLEIPTVPPNTPEGQHPFAAEIAHFVDCIEADVESHASIHDTWRSMALCFAIDRSAAEGGTPVRVFEPRPARTP